MAWNAPIATSVMELLERHARERPDALAFVAPSRSPATYAQLARHVAAIFRQLRGLGIARTDRVAVALPNGPEMAAAFLAVSAGAVCAPLNPAYRRGEFEALLVDLSARALIVSAGDVESEARAAARALGVPVLEIQPTLGANAPAGQFRLTGALGAPPAPADPSGPQDLALILYTSGMTSRPKAVPLSHRAICTSAHNIASALGLDPRDRCLNVMPLFHAHGLIIAVLSSLTAGGGVVCAPGFSAEEFFAWVREFRPTWYTAAPTIHHAVVEGAAEHRGLLGRVRLRFIRSSAAFLPPAVREGLEREFGSPVIEAYGMTECTQITSNPHEHGRRRPGSVGVPAGTSVGIRDENGNPLAPGQSGEIVIRGPAVMLGYDRNPEANRSAFLDGWFRTGDLGALSADGYLSLTGRLKDIINRGGEKIAPAEVDEVLLEHPAVAQAVTFGIPHPTLGEDVAAAVVLRPSGSATERDLRDFAATRLTESKLPRYILIVSEIPKGPTGKLKRAGLAETLGLSLPPDATLGGSLRFESIERRVARIWSELLKVDRIEGGANFFRLGGDSILASRLVARVRREFRVELPLRRVFEAPTLAELCSAIEREERQPGLSAPTRRAEPREGPLAALASEPAVRPAPVAQPATAPVAFSLFFFSADGSTDSREKYRLVLEAAQFADRHGYAAIWTPERHFHAFGGLYPNPAVLGAAIATVTNRIHIRAASVVLPLQNPIRVAEEWAVVDNLSRGRVGVSFASGWHVNDFVLWPSHYEDRRRVMFERVRILQDLWEGRPVTVPNGIGNEVAVSVFPRPIQPRLPIWFSCHSDASFRVAGELGAGVVTSMFVMSVDELADRIAAYNAGRVSRGHDPATGRVAVSLHTYLDEDPAAVREKVSGAYLDYLLVNLGLQAARVHGSGDAFEMPDEDREFLTRQASERLFAERGLVGTVAACRERVATLTAIGVNEIACLIDFGIDFDSVMASLHRLNKLKDLCNRPMQVSAGAR